MSVELELKRKKLALLKAKDEVRHGLPHLHGFPWYAWAKKFFDSRKKYCFLTAANQVSKSSTQIRKTVNWATDTELWPKLWNHSPLQFWYLYPTREVATIEFEKKWIPQFLPRGRFKDDPVYGWKPEYKNKFIWAVHFNSGVSVYFKTYATDVAHLQSGSCDAIFCDEELPDDLFDELNMRLAGTNGYFHAVFTATLSQEFWREVMEEKGARERLPDAFKQQISMYDCLYYEDGSPSPWSVERIQQLENSCKSKAEVQRRIHGKFVKDEGLKYPSFDPERNVKPGHPLPESWRIYAGIDVGSGGEKGHPAAIAFVAVSPDYRSARVFRGWRGDGVLTTAADVLLKYQMMKGSLPVVAAFYDWASKDFSTIAARVGEPILPAEKSHEIGEQVINVLFKNDMLAIYDLEELQGLVHELKTLAKDTPKTRARDDFADALRYCVSKIPFDWSAIQGIPLPTPEKPRYSEEEAKRRGVDQQSLEEQERILLDAEFEEWNDLYE